jgi:hypothetical protein
MRRIDGYSGLQVRRIRERSKSARERAAAVSCHETGAAMIRRGAVEIHWAARLLSLAVLAFWGAMLFGHLTGDAGRPSRPLGWQDFAMLGGTITALAGLAAAWKWERVGAVTSLVATGATALLNWRVLAFPATLIPISALLFLISGRLRRPGAASVPAESVSP